MVIVKEIIDETKNILDALLPDMKRLSYEHDLLNNSERELTNRFGFIAQEANFKEGSALGFTTMEHTFQLILTTDYQNKDSDAAQSEALNSLYSKVHSVLKDLQKKSITLPTSGYRVLLVSGVNFEAPEFLAENSTIILRTNLIYTYRFKNNF